MRKLLSVIISMGFVFWAGVSIASDAAMVISVTPGGAFYETGPNKGEPVELMAFLAKDVKISLRDDCELVLNYFSSERRERIFGVGLITIGERESLTGDGLNIDVSTSAFETPDYLINQSDSFHAGVIAFRGSKNAPVNTEGGVLDNRKNRFEKEFTGTGKIRPLTMYMTATTLDKPMFRWEKVEDAQGYRFSISYENGGELLDKMVWKEDYEYDGHGLSTNVRYVWKVEAKKGNEVIASGGGLFWLIDSRSKETILESEKRINDQETAGSIEKKLGLAMLYLNYNLYDQASEQLKKVAEEAGDNKALKKYIALVDLNSDVE